MNTITEAKDYLKNNWINGVNCPCCTQRVKLNPVKLTNNITRGLIELYKLDQKQPNGYFHISKIEAWQTYNHAGGGAFAKNKYWGLAVDHVNEDTKKRTSGMWAITELGRKFVREEIALANTVNIFNKKKYGESYGDSVTISQTLNKSFDYSEIMGEYIEPSKAVRWLED